MIAGQLDRGRGHQPHPLPGVEVLLRERPGARPDAVGHQLVVDLAAGLHDLVDRPPRDERQRVLPDGPDVVGAALAAGDAELGLLPDEPGHVAGREVLAGGQAAGEPEQRGAHHHRVVHVEERGRGGVRGDGGRRRDVGGRGGRGAGHVGPRRARRAPSGRADRRDARQQSRHETSLRSDRSHGGAGDLDPSGTPDGCSGAGPRRSAVADRDRREADVQRVQRCRGRVREAAGARAVAAPSGRSRAGVGVGSAAVGGGGRTVVGTRSRPGCRAAPGPSHRRRGPSDPGTERDGGRARPRRAGARDRPVGASAVGCRSRPAASAVDPSGRHSAGTGPSSSAPTTAGPAGQSSEDSSPVTRVAMSASSTRESGDVVLQPPRGRRPAGPTSPSDWAAAQPERSCSGPVVPGGDGAVGQPGGALGGLGVHGVQRLHDQGGVGAGREHGRRRSPATRRRAGRSRRRPRASAPRRGGWPARSSRVCPRASPARASWVCSVPRLTS